MNQTLRYFSVVALTGFASAGSAFAAEPPKEGSYDFTACWSGISNAVTFSKTHTASSQEMTGAIRSKRVCGSIERRLSLVSFFGENLAAAAFGTFATLSAPLRHADGIEQC